MKQKGRLLIVDQKQNTTSLEDIFRCYPFEICSAFTGESALNKMHESQFDVLITNFNLEDMNAMDLIRYGKNVNSALKCIVIADKKKAVHIKESDDVKIIQKPFQTEALSSLVEKLTAESPQCFEQKVLLVEDTQFMLLTEIKMLNEIGFQTIVTATDGDEAIEKLKTMGSEIGLIISDWNMPTVSGFNFLKWVRSDETCKNIPFIMATSLAEKKLTDKALKAGANDFLVKPFGIEELNKAIKNTLGTQNRPPKKSQKKARKTNSGKTRIFAGHIPITDHLVLGVLKFFISTGKFKPKYFELETQRMLLWNPIQKSLENGEIDVAFILAPIVIDIFNYGLPVKIVLLAHKNGSICIRNKAIGEVSHKRNSLGQFFKSKLFYLPHMLSVHHMLSDMYLRDIGLNPGYRGQQDVDVFFEVIPPIMMPDFQAKEKHVGGFMVAEPIGAKAIESGLGEDLFLTGELWNDHPCCVVAMRDEFIEKHSDAAHEFVNMLIKAGQYIANEPLESAKIAAKFLDPDQSLGFNQTILEKVLMEPKGIRTDDLIPVIDDFDQIQHYMHDKLNIGSVVDLEDLIDTRFIDG